MSSQVRIFLYISFAMAVFAIFLFHTSCKKETYISQEDFVNTLKGEWYVYRFLWEPTIYFDGDSIEYMHYSQDGTYHWMQMYSFDDPIVCTLEGIEHIQYWTITGDEDELILETLDLCGISVVYELEYENYRYTSVSQIISGSDRTDNIVADIRLVSPDTIITLKDFRYTPPNYADNQSKDDHLSFTVEIGYMKYNSYSLYSR